MHSYDFSWDRKAHRRSVMHSLPRSQSLYFVEPTWTPAPVNLEGTTSYYDPERIVAMRKRIAGVDKKKYYQDILSHILKDAKTDKERVAAVCDFVGGALYYNPVYLPVEPPPPGKSDIVGISDPIELLELHDGRCGQGVIVTLALLAEAGIEARQINLHHHVSCEARYEGGWHLADALMFGANQPHRDGKVLSGDEIKADPYYTDGFPLPYLFYLPEELTAEDGFRALGYVFGDWGTMPFHSWYWGAPKDCPPTLAFPLVTQRLGGNRVRLNWSPAFKMGGGEVEYRIVLYSDRDCKNEIHRAVTKANSYEWEVPQKNTMYYYEVAAMDDHRRFNPNTWYPALRYNFLLVPEEQYGWYGVI